MVEHQVHTGMYIKEYTKNFNEGFMEQKTKLKFNIIIILMIMLFSIATIPRFLQEDTYYMIKVGEYIVNNGMQVIDNRIEPFSWLERYEIYLSTLVIRCDILLDI